MNRDRWIGKDGWMDGWMDVDRKDGQMDEWIGDGWIKINMLRQ